jgi:hypothetical protein
MPMNQHDLQFACGVIDDYRRLIAAGRTQRWDVVKWTVTINMALAAASIAVKQEHVNAGGLFFMLAVGVVVIAGFFMWEVNRRMTATRNASLSPLKYLVENNVDVAAIPGGTLPEKYEANYDKEELRVYAVILLASVAPALFLWLLWCH